MKTQISQTNAVKVHGAAISCFLASFYFNELKGIYTTNEFGRTIPIIQQKEKNIVNKALKVFDSVNARLFDEMDKDDESSDINDSFVHNLMNFIESLVRNKDYYTFTELQTVVIQYIQDPEGVMKNVRESLNK